MIRVKLIKVDTHMKFIPLILLSLLPYSLIAESGEWFVGLEAGATGATLSETESTENIERGYGVEYGAKVGLREGNGRIYLGVTSANDIGSTISSTINPYIALEGVSNEFKVISKSTAKFFFGARFGASIADGNTTSTTAGLAGLQTGLIFLLPADLEIELAYRHYWTFRNSETDFNAGAAYGGLNYKFGEY